MGMTSFADFYTLAQFQALQDHVGLCPDYSTAPDAFSAWCQAGKPHDEVLDSAIAAFLRALRDAGRLEPVPAMYKRSHHLAHAWNAFVARTEDARQVERICFKVSYALMNVLKVRKADDVCATYRNIVEQADAGDFEWFRVDAVEECQTTGERLLMEWRNWAPCLGSRPERAEGYLYRPLIPAAAIEPPTVVRHEIDAPSGELLIADWFRIPCFTEAVLDPAEKACEYSISTAAGCQRQAQWYSRNFGFASISVGNSSPDLLVREGADADRSGHILLAHFEEDYRVKNDPAGGRMAGSVCTDLWWVTVIDRQVLTSILARTLTQAEAEIAVQVLIDDGNIRRVRVRPGKLFVYHTADYPDMNDFESAQAPTAGVEQLYGVISEREITFSCKAVV